MRAWALAVVLMGMGMAQLPSRPSCLYAKLERGDGVLGYALWFVGDSKPYGWVRSDVLLADIEQAVMTALHEEMHVIQLREEANSYTASEDARIAGGPERMFRMEAEAYCVSARAAVSFGKEKTLGDAVRKYAGHLADPMYGFNVSPAEAEAKIWEYCP